MKEKLKIGVIGLGGRGSGILEHIILEMDDIDVVAVCDTYEDRRLWGAKKVTDRTGIEPLCTEDYRDILAMEKVDAVILTTSWADHVHIAIAAMEAGKYVATEVGGAHSIDECFELVKTYEKTGVPCMMLENCCYGRDELLVLNMVKQGIFGDIVHCRGGYCHDLRDEISSGKENRHYRLVNYINRNCENYPTHELGPIARVLDINRGNRMVALTSMASKAAGLHEYIIKTKGAEHELAHVQFAQGDIITTTIKCAHGETILLTLDTTLPRAYTRGFTVQGTKGMYMEDTKSIFMDEEHANCHFNWSENWNNVEKYREKYEHPLWKKYLLEGVKGGHDGMDWLVFRAFFDSVKNGVQTPIDVYDMASWMSITALSEQSIAMGGTVVSIPDFTNGKWLTRKDYE